MFREGLLQYWWMLYRHSKILNQRTEPSGSFGGCLAFEKP
jgi:hypothetical protein